MLSVVVPCWAFDGLNTGKVRGEKNAERHCNHWLCMGKLPDELRKQVEALSSELSSLGFDLVTGGMGGG